MKAFVFAAGLGTRLKPWTDSHPKALAEVNGKTLLERVVEGIARRSPVDEYIVNIHHFPQQVLDHISESKILKDKKIAISDETDLLLETGGALLKAKDLLDKQNILVHNSDILTDFDYNLLIDFHDKEDNDITLLLNQRDSSRKLLWDNKSRMRGWVNHKTGEKIAMPFSEEMKELSFAGIHLINYKAIELMEEYSRKISNKKFGIIPFYLWAMDKIKIGGFLPDKEFKWLDVGRPEALEEAKKLFR